jgi:hypothetical protein
MAIDSDEATVCCRPGKNITKALFGNTASWRAPVKGGAMDA